MKAVQRQGLLWIKIIALGGALFGVFYLMNYLKSPDYSQSKNMLNTLFMSGQSKDPGHPSQQKDAAGQDIGSPQSVSARVVVGDAMGDGTICKANAETESQDCTKKSSGSQVKGPDQLSTEKTSSESRK